MAFLPLFPETGARPKLVGIARIAADGESLREGHNVEYFTLGSRSLLSRVVSGRNLPFTWAINPYRGCEFACKYCYARYTHEFMELRDGVDFERKIFVKQHAAALLQSELKKVRQGEAIAIGTATDPYQPAERRFEITRAILEELARHSGLRDWNRDQVEPGDTRCGDFAAGGRAQPDLCECDRDHGGYRTGTKAGAAGATARSAAGGGSPVESGGRGCGRDLRSGAAGDYRTGRATSRRW